MPEIPEEWKRPSGMRKFGFWAPLACLILTGVLHTLFPDWAETPRDKYIEPTPHWKLTLWGAAGLAAIALFVFFKNNRWREVLFLLASYAAFGCLIAVYIASPRSKRIVLLAVTAIAAAAWGAFTGLRRLLGERDTRNRVNAALDLLAKGRMRAALTELNRAIKHDDSNGAAWLTRGLVLADTGHDAQAIADLTKADSLDDGFLFAVHMRGILHGRQGRYKEAVADFTEALERGPHDSDICLHRAEALIALGKYQQAWDDAVSANELKDPSTFDLVLKLRQVAPELEP